MTGRRIWPSSCALLFAMVLTTQLTHAQQSYRVLLTEIQQPGDTLRIDALHCAGDQTVYALGPTALVSRTAGRSWEHLAYQRIEGPIFGIDDRILLSRDAHLSQNSGASWQPLEIDLLDSLRGEVSVVAAASRSGATAVLTLGRDDVTGTPTKDPARVFLAPSPLGPWQRADSLGPNGRRITGSGPLGPLPVPSRFIELFEWNWQFVAPTPDSDIVAVGLLVGGHTGTAYELQPYLGLIDVAASSVEWVELPFSEQTLIGLAIARFGRLLAPNPTSDGSLFIVARLNGGTAGARRVIWRSLDSGRTWDSTGLLPVDFTGANATFVSRNVIVGNGWRSNDAGATWSCWPSPLPSGLFCAVDSANYVLAAWPYVLTSSDAGRTWGTRRTASISASGGLLFVGVAEGKVLRSVDAGESWREPGHLSYPSRDLLHALPVDSSNSHHLIGLARGWADSCGAATAFHVVESFDTGKTWTTGPRVVGLADSAHIVRLHLFASGSDTTLLVRSDLGLFRSEDAGTSWERIEEGPTRPGQTSIAGAHLWIGWRQLGDELGAVIASTDMGRTWQERSRLPLPDDLINSPDRIYAWPDGQVRMVAPSRILGHPRFQYFTSSDSGSTWTSAVTVPADTPGSFIYGPRGVVETIAAAKARIYALDEGTLELSLLKDASDDFPHGITLVATDSTYVYFGSPDGSIARWKISAPITSAPLPVGGASLPGVSLRDEQLTISLNPSSGRDVASLRIYSMLGEEVIVTDARREAGRWVADGVRLEPGLYLLRLDGSATTLFLPVPGR